MEHYKSPESAVDISTVRNFKPVRAIIFGLLISVFLMLIVSSIGWIAAAIVLGLDITNNTEMNAVLTNNVLYLSIDLLVSALILYFAGTIVRKYTPGKEVKFGLILSFLTLTSYIFFAFRANAFSQYPIWYSVLVITLIVTAVQLGVRPKIKS